MAGFRRPGVCDIRAFVWRKNKKKKIASLLKKKKKPVDPNNPQGRKLCS
ncbi:MAG: hypothetical protein OER56_05295 [Hyphomicrobiales bacterium]|nr:hypothetical protein [Hyphomicrobiales bacterium]